MDQAEPGAELAPRRASARSRYRTRDGRPGGRPVRALLGIVHLMLGHGRKRTRASQNADRFKQLQCQLRAAYRDVEHLQAAVARQNEFLLMVVHELRSPLAHIVGYTDLLSEHEESWQSGERAELHAAVEHAAGSMARLLNDLAEIARLQAAGFVMRPRPVDLSVIIWEVARGFAGSGASHTLTLTLEHERLTVFADPDRVRQVLTNLLSNAVVYTPPGGAIAVCAQPVGTAIRVEVQDQGYGLAPEELNRVFEKFYRGRAGRMGAERGSGLGLPIVKQIVEAHGGQIGVCSVQGEGSTFWFTLPAADETPSTAEATGADGEQRPATSPSPERQQRRA